MWAISSNPFDFVWLLMSINNKYLPLNLIFNWMWSGKNIMDVTHFNKSFRLKTEKVLFSDPGHRNHQPL